MKSGINAPKKLKKVSNPVVPTGHGWKNIAANFNPMDWVEVKIMLI